MADRLTRILSLALRHKPELFGISLDERGWTSLPALVPGIKRQFPSLPADEETIRTLVDGRSPKRFELRGNDIRALYGHSISHVAVGEHASPPPLLFHATRADFLDQIRRIGLLAAGRKHVHLTSCRQYALSLRDTHNRASHRGIVLAVHAGETHHKGVPFFRVTDIIWYCPYVPPTYLSLSLLNLKDEDIGLVRLVGNEPSSSKRRAALGELFTDEHE